MSEGAEPEYMSELWGGDSALVRRSLASFREYLMEDREALLAIMQPVIDGSTDVHRTLSKISDRLMTGCYNDTHNGRSDSIRRAADKVTNAYAMWVTGDAADCYDNLDIEDLALEHIPMPAEPKNIELMLVMWGIENQEWSDNDNYCFFTPIYSPNVKVSDDASGPQDSTQYIQLVLDEERGNNHRGLKNKMFKGDLGANFIWCWDEREGQFSPPVSMSERAQDNYALVGMLSYLQTNPSRDDDNDDDDAGDHYGWCGGTTISSPHAMSFLMATYRYLTGEDNTLDMGEDAPTPRIPKSPQTFVDSATDNRRPLDLDSTEGLPQAYLEVVRCVVCNGRVKLAMSLASVKTLATCDCPHCEAQQGVKNPYLKEA